MAKAAGHPKKTRFVYGRSGGLIKGMMVGELGRRKKKRVLANGGTGRKLGKGPAFSPTWVRQRGNWGGLGSGKSNEIDLKRKGGGAYTFV